MALSFTSVLCVHWLFWRCRGVLAEWMPHRLSTVCDMRLVSGLAGIIRCIFLRLDSQDTLEERLWTSCWRTVYSFVGGLRTWEITTVGLCGRYINIVTRDYLLLLLGIQGFLLLNVSQGDKLLVLLSWAVVGDSQALRSWDFLNSGPWVIKVLLLLIALIILAACVFKTLPAVILRQGRCHLNCLSSTCWQVRLFSLWLGRLRLVQNLQAIPTAPSSTSKSSSNAHISTG